MAIALASATGQGTLAPAVWGADQRLMAALTYSGSYTTGGEALAATLENLFKLTGRGTVEWVQVTGVPGYLASYNYETGKLQVFRGPAALKGAFEEFPEEAYAAAITGAKAKLFAVGK